MGKWEKLSAYRDAIKSWNAREQWSQVTRITSQGFSSALSHINTQKVRFAVGMVIVGSLAGASFLGNQYVKANTNIIYHVIYKGQVIGTVDQPSIIEGWLLQQYQAAKKLYPGTNIEMDPVLTYESEKLYKGEASNEETLAKLSSLMNIQAQAVEIVVDGERIGYARSIEEAQQILDSIKKDFTNGPIPTSKNQVHIASQEFSTLKIKEVGFVENVELNTVEIEPGKVSNPEDIEQIIRRGTLETVEHVVKEGDCLSCIAQQYGISVDEIYRNNPDLDGEKLSIDQVLNVTALQPRLTVRTIESQKIQEEIAFAVETIKDDDLARGVTRTKQEGQMGLKAVTYNIIRENGEVVEKKAIGETVLEEPVKKIVIKGTKIIPGVGTGKFAWPVSGKLTSRYGMRWGKLHAGIDISGSNRTILASDTGRVVYAGWDSGYGNVILIDHGNGFKTRYAHLRSIKVKVGQNVERGQSIGIMGNTGHSYGTHLHFEILKNGSPVNPLKYL
jgi:murein DD-endopeptidase MepM/ murein hydrolase activator NlpD